MLKYWTFDLTKTLSIIGIIAINLLVLTTQQKHQLFQQLEAQQKLPLSARAITTTASNTTATATNATSSGVTAATITTAATFTTFIANINNSRQQQHNQPQQQRNGYAHIAALDKEVVERLIKQWAPIVWLAPEEKFMPLGVDEFLNNVHPMDKEHNFIPGIPFSEYSTKSYLVTNTEVDELLDDEASFLYGRNPNESPVPIYAVVALCGKPATEQSTLSTRQDKVTTAPSSISTVEALPFGNSHAAYIPISINPQDARNETLRRSSRFYPLFQRVKREVTPPVFAAVGGTATEVLEYMPFAPPLQEYDLKNHESNNIPDSSFMANLADNVKFSGGTTAAENSNTLNMPNELRDKRKMPAFHVTYWMFYPYSQGKTMCTLSLGPFGRIPFPAVYGYCLGRKKDIGSHIGDWEHMSLYFNGDAEPEAMYVSAHDAGAYYSYNHLTGTFEFKRQETRKGILQHPKFPKTVTTFNDHPVLFAAKGSHGLWTAPGKHRIVKVARVYDINGFGTPWNTWKSVDISYENVKSYGRSLVPSWLTYKGKWGNPKNKCHPFRRIGLNFCELTDGPTGIPLKEPHFECGATYR